MNGAVTKTQFAQILGCTKPYVSQLVATKRLVLSDDGKRVMVDASLELLGATSDPSKAGVRERWADFRATQALVGAPTDAAPPPAVLAISATVPAAQASLIDEPAQPSGAVGLPVPATPARSEYQDARTLREQAEAEMAQINLMKARGQVLEADGALRAIADAHIAVRAEILALPDRLAQMVAAEVDARKVWELINVECRRLCERIEEQARALSAAHSEVTA